MISYKKGFFFLCLFLLFSSYSHAAYKNSWKIDDCETLKKTEAAGQALIDKQAAFWTELKYFFKWEKFCHHKIKGYLSIIEFLFDKIQDRPFSKEGMSHGWKDIDAVTKTFEKHFPQDQAFHAFIILRNMILSSALFRNLENINFQFQNGFGMFWGPVQIAFNKRQDIHRLCSFCEIIIFLKSLERFLSKNAGPKSTIKEQIAAEKALFVEYVGGEIELVGEEKVVYKGIYKDCLLLNDLKVIWLNLDFGLWSSAVYKLIENFCLNSQIFKELEK